MSNTAVRYLTMLRMVPRYPKSITTPELASRLEGRGFSVTMRSIQRDLEKLSADFPLLVDEDSRPYRWSFDRDATMDIIPALDLPAALTFELARAYLSPMLPPRALSHLKPHFDEAHRTLLREKNPLGQWPNRVRVINRGLGGQRPSIDADVLEAVTEALLREYQCQLTYQARNWPEPEEIVVHPYGLIFRDPNVYLIGTIEGREGIRQLVLHRATEGAVVEEPTVRPDDFDLDLYIRSGAMGILKSEEPVYLKLRCDRPVLNHLIESPLGFDQLTSELDDKSFEIAVTVGDTQDLRWWLTAQAVHCDILEPAWLRQEIEATLEQGLRRVRQDP
ncbi:Predicted DNA-binding transcriptional regulator YafY, contains an HTH and WYL domains [Marinobacter segnicrescens]|uniref:Predicted DNA-binding transcriptional regulator YafY, contains an HTH and WYL domains n=1 Tax=Marinobacter segnicrescens TaxID=430453 RepID=A0A1I0GXB5_9GAMM|nr:WYL domain-containing protein [Marinobacter segnicrescens]SET75185.1 Predicted DNA-binding transcriptional regulator YafY, contains an HTH and WYL domains [Marinobacter segnicrescens]